MMRGVFVGWAVAVTLGWWSGLQPPLWIVLVLLCVNIAIEYQPEPRRGWSGPLTEGWPVELPDGTRINCDGVSIDSDWQGAFYRLHNGAPLSDTSSSPWSEDGPLPDYWLRPLAGPLTEGDR